MTASIWTVFTLKKMLYISEHKYIYILLLKMYLPRSIPQLLMNERRFHQIC